MLVAPGSGVTCSILLAEPNLFLLGFDHYCHTYCEGQNGTALWRGTLQLCVKKNTKIKAVQLKLRGRARTEWPQKMKSGFYEEENLQTQVLTFFNAMSNCGKYDYGNQCTYRWKSTSPNDTNFMNQLNTPKSLTPHYHSNISAKRISFLSPDNVQTQCFNNKGSLMATATQVKWYKVFYPGTYDYAFELPIDYHQLETMKVPYGSVKWELRAAIDRAGMFNINLHARKELSFVRVPDPLSTEMMESILFSRQWRDQLHYDIIISGKSFPIGSKIPIVLKLRPLDKVQVHGLKVLVTESIEYWSNDRKATRKTPLRTVLLLDKMAGKAPSPIWASPDLRTVRDGELTPELRREACETAAELPSARAAGRQTAVQPLPETRDSLLGNSDPGSESFWGTTEIEAAVQIPTCRMMVRREDLRLHPKCIWKNVTASHRIKVILRISRLDPDDPTGKKRKYFETVVHSPFTLLNCRATQANIKLPSYSDEICQSVTCQTTCGCPDASTIPAERSPRSLVGTLAGVDLTSGDPSSPQRAAHLANDQQSARPPTEITRANDHDRPVHLLRGPNFNRPSFNNDIAPPQAPELPESGVMSLPPHYDDVVGGANVDGLADYFSRLADYYLDRTL